MASSTPLTTANIGARQQHGSSYSPGSKMPKFDDSSSTTSMSTVNRNLCTVCKEPESKPTKPFIFCLSCKRPWHPCCPHPPVPNKDWMDEKFIYYCSHRRCQSKKTSRASAASEATSRSAASSNPRGSSAVQNNAASLEPSGSRDTSTPILSSPGAFRDAKKMLEFSQCQESGCGNPLFSHVDAKERLCHKHRIAKKNRDAKATVPLVKPQLSKAINKSKLHPMKPEERQFLKRKRQFSPFHTPSIAESGPGDDHLLEDSESITIPTTTFMSQSPHVYPMHDGNPRTIVMEPNDRSASARPASAQYLSSLGMESDLQSDAKTQTSDKALLTTISSFQKSSAETNTGTESTSSGNLHISLQDAEILHFSGGVKKDIDRLEKIIKDYASAWGLDLTIEHPKSLEKQQHKVIPEGAVTPLIAGNEFFSPHEQHHSRHIPSEPTASTLASLSEGIPSRAEYEETAPHLDSLGSKQLIQDAVSNPQVSPEADEDVAMGSAAFLDMAPPLAEEQLDTDYNILFAPPSPSLLLVQNAREVRGARTDLSNLDAYFKQQAGPSSLGKSSNQLFIDSQIWAACNPRESWPEVQPNNFADEKRAEIAARPRRKANFGVLLTEQTKRERLDRGWDVHQTRERDGDEEARIAKDYEAIFGMPFWDTEDTIRPLGWAQRDTEKVAKKVSERDSEKKAEKNAEKKVEKPAKLVAKKVVGKRPIGRPRTVFRPVVHQPSPEVSSEPDVSE